MLFIEYHIYIWQVLRGSASVTPVKYECDSKILTGTFARWEMTGIAAAKLLWHLLYMNVAFKITR